MTTATTTTGTYQGKTADQWREEAAESNRRRNESWDRCDTDGFVSQWAHQMGEGENHLKAQLAEQNGMTETRALFDLDGNLIPAVHGWSDFGEYFIILDAEGNKDITRGRKGFFNPSQAEDDDKARAADAKKGFFVGTVRVPAITKIVGGGKGLAGAASCYPAIVPASKTITADTAEIVDNGHEQPVVEDEINIGQDATAEITTEAPVLKGKAQRRVYGFLAANPGFYTVPEIVKALNAAGENTYYNATSTALKALAAAGVVVLADQDGKAAYAA